MKRICILCSTVPPYFDAVGESAIKLQKLLINNGYDVLILTSNDQKPGTGILPFMNNWGFAEIIRAAKYLRKEGYDGVILEYPSPYFRRNVLVNFIPLLFLIWRIKAITYLHEYEEYTLLGKLRIQPFLLFSKKIVTSDRVNLNALKKIVYARQKSHFISSGSNFYDDSFKGALSGMEMTDTRGKTKILYFGFIMEGKGLDILIDLLESEPELNNRFEFHIVGSLPENPGAQAVELHSRIASSTHLKYHGFLEESAFGDLLKTTDLIFLPYNKGVTERRGSFMTCMAFGKPVITSAPAYTIAGLEDCENVLFLTSLQKEVIVEKLRRVSEYTPEKLRSIGANAHKWYMERFSDSILVEKFIDVIKSTE